MHEDKKNHQIRNNSQGDEATFSVSALLQEVIFTSSSHVVFSVCKITFNLFF